MVSAAGFPDLRVDDLFVNWDTRILERLTVNQLGSIQRRHLEVIKHLNAQIQKCERVINGKRKMEAKTKSKILVH